MARGRAEEPTEQVYCAPRRKQHRPHARNRCLRCDGSTHEEEPVSLWQDVRYAARLLVKDKWFTAVAAVALALGIGVNTTVFTLVNVVLLRGLPFAEPERIIALGMTNPKGQRT